MNYYGPVEDATSAYLNDYAREQEALDNCAECEWCGEKILPHQTAKGVYIGSRWRWVHDWHLDDCDEQTGEELMDY